MIKPGRRTPDHCGPAPARQSYERQPPSHRHLGAHDSALATRARRSMCRFRPAATFGPLSARSGFAASLIKARKPSTAETSARGGPGVELATLGDAARFMEKMGQRTGLSRQAMTPCRFLLVIGANQPRGCKALAPDRKREFLATREAAHRSGVGP
jgi:hypothetical protein